MLAFGTYDLAAHPRADVVMEGLRAHGFDVDQCNVPLGLGTAARVSVLKQPWRLPALAWRIASRWLRLWRLSKAVPPADAVLVPYMGHFDVHLARVRFRRTPLVLDHLVSASDTARDRRASGAIRERVLRLLDGAALRAAHVVLVDTEEHLGLLPEGARSKAVVVPVGATDAWLCEGRSPYDGRRPLRVIFFGLFTPLQGTLVIGRALGLLTGEPGIEVSMVGEGQDEEGARLEASANPSVRWRGLVDAEELPPLLAGHDVCLGIFGTTDKALRVVPNKVYQGLRAGCAVVTSDTPPQRRVLGGSVAYVPPGDPDALADTLRELAAAPARVQELQAAARAMADRIGPRGVAEPLVARLADLGLRGEDPVR